MKKQKFHRAPPKNRDLIHLQNQNGRFEVAEMHWLSLFRDPYHWLLTLSWRDFFLAISLAYMGLNLLFGLAYYLGGDCIANAKPGVFSDYFFFSVQTLASIGYGAMYPGNFYANSLVTFESLIGLTGIALITGLAFARFSKPTARVMFSNVAVISNHDDQCHADRCR